ncbi:hypothetical protein CTA2_6650 [Colletotrichum tanaceti]|nr:hypothetical protein CTA2_6650 [Colletotrichum tanaceti]
MQVDDLSTVHLTLAAHPRAQVQKGRRLRLATTGAQHRRFRYGIHGVPEDDGPPVLPQFDDDARAYDQIPSYSKTPSCRLMFFVAKLAELVDTPATSSST